MTEAVMTTRFRRSTITCPVCNAGAAIRTSEQITPLFTDLFICCSNPTCGITWKGAISFTYVLSPSGIDHDLDLPQPPPDVARQLFKYGPPPTGPDPNQPTFFEHEDQAA